MHLVIKKKPFIILFYFFEYKYKKMFLLIFKLNGFRLLDINSHFQEPSLRCNFIILNSFISYKNHFSLASQPY